ncbi:MAG: hypothetical protein WCP33_08635 [Deltaproteobacteria bacterium]
MKKVTAVVAVLALALAIGSTVQAGNQMGSMHGDWGNCNQAGASVTSDQMRKFQSDTIDLRQEMMKKRFEIQRENLKPTTDNTKISALQTEIKAIQSKINEIRVKSGLPERGKGNGGCGHMGGRGGCGSGQMPDCMGGAPCGGR